MMSTVPSLMRLPKRLDVRRRHPKTQAVGPQLLDVFPGAQKHRPGIDFATARPAFILGAPQHRQSFRRAHVKNMQPRAERLLHAEQRAHRGVPDDAVIVAICFRVGLRAAIFALPVAPFDLIHQILIVRVDHQWQAGLPTVSKHLKSSPLLLMPMPGMWG